jgi:hypothetical protein
MSPELETLDQLLGGDVPLSVVRTLYPDDPTFTRSIHAMLRAGDVRLLSADGVDVPPWTWRELFSDGKVWQEILRFTLSATEQGARRMT